MIRRVNGEKEQTYLMFLEDGGLDADSFVFPVIGQPRSVTVGGISATLREYHPDISTGFWEIKPDKHGLIWGDCYDVHLVWEY